MGTNCTSEPFRASTGVSPGFTLPPPRSPGFWFHGSGSRPFGTPPLAGLNRLRACRFPYAYGALTPLNSPLPWTPRPVFQDGRRNPDRLPTYSRVAPVSSGKLHFLEATPYVAARFQALFTPLPGFFSAFPHGTKFAIGLGTYLVLEVGDPQLPTAKPSRGTQASGRSPHGLAYGTITLYGGAFQPTSATMGRLPRGLASSRRLTTPHLSTVIPWRIGLNSPPFGRPYSGDPILVSSPPPTKMFPFGGFPFGTPPTQG